MYENHYGDENSLTPEKRKYPMVVYAGNNLSPNYLNDLFKFI